MSKSPRTSIIIAVKADNPNLRECLEACGRLTDQDFEILVLPDEACELPFPKLQVLPTGPAGPSYKRDRGAQAARGSILAFLDDDAFPAPEWLEAAVAVLQQQDVAAVGGPAVTPPEDGDREQASGLVYSSWLVGGPFAFRYLPQNARDVDDYPTCNLLIKKAPFLQIGGFDTCYWPGEDTVVCLKLTHQLKQRIVYDPRVLVYHHRRPLYRGHLQQVISYAKHRGYFVKKFPQTSLRPGYFFPSAWVLFAALGWLPGLLWHPALGLWWGILGLYAALLLVSGFQSSFRYFWLIVSGIAVTHAAYGVFFIRGLLMRQLKEESQERPGPGHDQ